MHILFGITVITSLIAFVTYMFLRRKNIIYKIQIATSLTTLSIILMTMFFYMTDKPEYIDIAILYALLGYVSMIATSKYLVFNLEKQKEE